jgi:hypothetical protein
LAAHRKQITPWIYLPAVWILLRIERIVRPRTPHPQANIIGTTGASMLLIRPWIAMNRNHFGGMHTAFFIFTVSNIGGALLLVGPPLFLGYLKDVPFLWALQRCWLPWSVTLAAVLIIFCVLDSLLFSEETPLTRARKRVRARRKLALRWRDQFHFHARDSRCAHCRGRGMARNNYGFDRGRSLPVYAAAPIFVPVSLLFFWKRTSPVAVRGRAG